MKRRRWSVLLLVVLAAVTFLVLFSGWNMEEVRAALRTARPGWLALGAFFLAAFVCCEAGCTWTALRAMGVPTPYRRCFLASVSGFYFSSVTPSATGGQPAQVFYLARMGVEAAYGALDMLLLTVCYQTVTVLYALGACLISPAPAAGLGTGLGVLLGYGITSTALLTGALLILLLRPGLAERVGRWAIGLGARLKLLREPERWQEKLTAQLVEYGKGTALLRRCPVLFPKLMALTAAQMTFLYLIPWTVYRALGLQGVSAVQLTATQALLALAVGSLPIPGTVGAAEAAFLTAYEEMFAPLTAPALLLARGLSFYLPLVLTGIGVLLLHRATGPKARSAKTR